MHKSTPKHSWSGRPIYTRFGDESRLAEYFGIASALISNFQNHDDTIRSMIAGQHKFVFLLKGPLYLVCISRTEESISQLTVQLEYAHRYAV